MKLFLKQWGLKGLRAVLGVKVVDQRSGEVVGRVVVLPWKGGLRLIGLEGVALRPHFLPQAREVYWAQDLGFSTYPPPDFPHVENQHCSDIAPGASGGVGDGRGVAAPQS